MRFTKHDLFRCVVGEVLIVAAFLYLWGYAWALLMLGMFLIGNTVIGILQRQLDETNLRMEKARAEFAKEKAKFDQFHDEVSARIDAGWSKMP